VLTPVGAPAVAAPVGPPPVAAPADTSPADAQPVVAQPAAQPVVQPVPQSEPVPQPVAVVTRGPLSGWRALDIEVPSGAEDEAEPGESGSDSGYRWKRLDR
jgi:hypothetical protein